jgi:hypothetical protein
MRSMGGNPDKFPGLEGAGSTAHLARAYEALDGTYDREAHWHSQNVKRARPSREKPDAF